MPSPTQFSNGFATLNYKVVSKNFDFTIHHIIISKSDQELDTLQRLCELERIQLIPILATSVKKPSTSSFSITR